MDKLDLIVAILFALGFFFGYNVGRSQGDNLGSRLKNYFDLRKPFR